MPKTVELPKFGKTRNILLLSVCSFVLAACQNASFFGPNVERPKGPGANTDDLRPSPCACIELPNTSPDMRLYFDFGGLKG
jgi:hypothetical protein